MTVNSVLIISADWFVLFDWWMQVHSLEAANQMLETEIQLELDRKCPRELRHLDTHLRTVSLLQMQVS